MYSKIKHTHAHEGKLVKNLCNGHEPALNIAVVWRTRELSQTLAADSLWMRSEPHEASLHMYWKPWNRRGNGIYKLWWASLHRLGLTSSSGSLKWVRYCGKQCGRLLNNLDA